MELAVKHVQYLHDKYGVGQQKENERATVLREEFHQRVNLRVVTREISQQRVNVHAVTRLPGGEFALVLDTSQRLQTKPRPEEPMWRPW